MTKKDAPAEPTETMEVDLKNPGLAALLAWLWPGAGHLYQGRTAKGILYMVCITSIYFYGLAVGHGHVVYASWRQEDRRLPYLCQVGVGLPALPALVRAGLKHNENDPNHEDRTFWQSFMARPYVATAYDPRYPAEDELSKWHREAGLGFELGTLYTMIAGLLNILAIYDAFAGPVFAKPDEERAGSATERGPPPGGLLGWIGSLESTLGFVGAIAGVFIAYNIRQSLELSGPVWAYGLAIVCGAAGAVLLGGGVRFAKTLLVTSGDAGDKQAGAEKDADDANR